MVSYFAQGRFGNQLFQYAITRIVAARNNYDFYIPRDGFMPTGVFHDLDLGREDLAYNQIFWEYDSQQFDENVFNVADGTMFVGFFQTEKYFIGFEDQIRTWFHVDSEPIDEPDTTCYIHFRVGDYLYEKQFLPFDYYEKAKERMRMEVPDIRFKIITDDFNLAKIKFVGDEIVSNENRTMFDDFKTLKSTKYMIASNSTFSWWARWLNNDCKLALAPAKWYNYANEESDWFPYDIRSDKFEYVNNG